MFSMASFEAQTRFPFRFDEVQCIFFFFCHLCFGIICKKPLPNEILNFSYDKMRLWGTFEGGKSSYMWEGMTY